jgi:cation diffusion facilitator CzcD-associated flavoprotein CzcO
MAGVCMGVMLKRAGFNSFTIVERSPSAGGTWWDNVYPGAQCDVPSHLYAFSFEPNADWSRAFAPAREIRSYLEHCIDKYGLSSHLRLGTSIVEATYSTTDRCWTLRTSAGEVMRADVFICSVGPLNRPRLPDGIDAFRGKVMHSARWDEAYEFRGKRVALVGSAASAVQIVPHIANVASRLTVFQRTPSWILPRPDRAYSAPERALYRLRPVARLIRWWHYWLHDIRYVAFSGRGFIHRAMGALANRHRGRQVRDPELREKLRPRYPLGCKRVLISNDFYPALGRSNVDLRAAAAVEFRADSVVGADGSVHAVDAIVCATGFDTLELLPDVTIRGASGMTLTEATAGGAEAYRGTCVPGFPNLFLLLGPNTGTGHTSALLALETQARYVVKCLEKLVQRGSRTIEVLAEPTREHNRDLQRRLSQTVWASLACGSWYKTRTGKIVAIYPGPTTRFFLEMRSPRFEDFSFDCADVPRSTP